MSTTAIDSTPTALQEMHISAPQLSAAKLNHLQALEAESIYILREAQPNLRAR